METLWTRETQSLLLGIPTYRRRSRLARPRVLLLKYESTSLFASRFRFSPQAFLRASAEEASTSRSGRFAGDVASAAAAPTATAAAANAEAGTLCVMSHVSRRASD